MTRAVLTQASWHGSLFKIKVSTVDLGMEQKYPNKRLRREFDFLNRLE
jgi:hypothetical protein